MYDSLFCMHHILINLAIGNMISNVLKLNKKYNANY